MKEYFTHDYNARSDPRLIRLQMKHGMEGLGAYWCIIEMLYEEGGYLPVDEYERITFELRTNYDLIQNVIHNFGLFTTDDNLFWSESVIKRLKVISDKSEKARQSISKRWEKYERITNVLRTYNDGNTIKGNNIKGNNIKGNEKAENFDFDILTKNDVWMQTTYSNAKISENADVKFDRYEELMKVFIAEQKLNGIPKSEWDYRNHFTNWIKIQFRKHENQVKKMMMP